MSHIYLIASLLCSPGQVGGAGGTLEGGSRGGRERVRGLPPTVLHQSQAGQHGALREDHHVAAARGQGGVRPTGDPGRTIPPRSQQHQVPSEGDDLPATARTHR